MRHGSEALCGSQGTVAAQCFAAIRTSLAPQFVRSNLLVAISDSSLRSQSVTETIAAPRLPYGHYALKTSYGPMVQKTPTYGTAHQI